MDEFESPFDRDQAEIRWNRRLHASEQRRAKAREDASAVVLDQSLLELWWSFVQNSKARRLAEGEVEAEGYPEKTKPELKVWIARMESLRRRDPAEFLEKIAAYTIDYSLYLENLHDVSLGVRDDIGKDLGSDFFDDKSEDWKNS